MVSKGRANAAADRLGRGVLTVVSVRVSNHRVRAAGSHQQCDARTWSRGRGYPRPCRHRMQRKRVAHAAGADGIGGPAHAWRRRLLIGPSVPADELAGFIGDDPPAAAGAEGAVTEVRLLRRDHETLVEQATQTAFLLWPADSQP
jgi:hypothetical protein